MIYINFIGEYTIFELKEIFDQFITIEIIDDEDGCYAVIEENQFQFIKILCMEENIKILISHNRDALCVYMLQYCNYPTNEVRHISDLVFQRIKKDDAKIYSYLEQIFSNLESYLLHTLKVYMENNMNVVQTAKQIYTHRNTLNYRLQQIEDITGVNIRKYKNLLLFYYYLNR